MILHTPYASRNHLSMTYAKTFIPLESDPSILTSLLHNLGGSRDLQFIDVWSLDDPDQLALIPRPVLAFVLILPTSAEHETKKAEQEAERKERGESGNSGDVVFLQQTIHNACGLYAILHAACNTQRADAIGETSVRCAFLDFPVDFRWRRWGTMMQAGADRPPLQSQDPCSPSFSPSLAQNF